MIRRSLIRKWPLRALAACACLAAGPVAVATADGGGAVYSSAASAPSSTPTAPTGTATPSPAPPPIGKALVLPDGTAQPPADAPAAVQSVILAANRLVGKPYRWGGGHRKAFTSQLDSGYDCSGAVSFALAGGAFLRSPLPSGLLMRWGVRGRGRWLTVYAHGGHAYLVVAGLRFDTSLRPKTARGRNGPAWSKRMRPSTGFVARHPRLY